MTLKATVDTLEEVPSEHHELYVETDAGYALDVEGLHKPSEITTLKTALKKERDTRSALQNKLRTFDTLVELPDDELQDKLEKLAALDDIDDDDDGLDNRNNKGQFDQASFDRALMKATGKLKRDQDKLSKKNQELAQQLEAATAREKNRTVEDTARSIFSKVKLKDPTAQQDAMMWAKMNFELDEDGVLVKTDDPVTTYEDWVVSQKEERPYWFGETQGAGLRGGSKKGAKRNNPWDPKSRSISEQTKLYLEDPEKARSMAKQHGVTL